MERDREHQRISIKDRLEVSSCSCTVYLSSTMSAILEEPDTQLHHLACNDFARKKGEKKKKKKKKKIN
jgi:hypothetical protein